MSQGNSTDESAQHSVSAFSSQLMSKFSQVFGAQSQALNFLSGKMTSMMANPTGFTPGAMAAMNTAATTGVATAYNNAETAAKEVAAQQGGNGLPSGVAAQVAGENANAAAQTESAAQNQIQLANAQQEQSNYWNAASGEAQVASLENPASYAGEAIGGYGALSGLVNADTAASQSSFGGIMEGALGKGLGSALGGVTGPLGGGFSLGKG